VKCFIAGATGVLGRRVVAGLTARGTEVVGLACTRAAGSVIRSLGGRPAHVDLFDAAGLAQAMRGADVVIHAATAIPPGFRARFRTAWEENGRIRGEGTRVLATATATAGGPLYLQQNAPRPPRISGRLARLLLGPHVLESLTTSMSTCNAKIRRELGWTPCFPSCREGIAHMVGVWRREKATSSALVAP
jgi:nucleoside-diphosphate-sugar epimerase